MPRTFLNYTGTARNGFSAIVNVMQNFIDEIGADAIVTIDLESHVELNGLKTRTNVPIDKPA